jgi:restriction endonuclease Mrr
MSEMGIDGVGKGSLPPVGVEEAAPTSADETTGAAEPGKASALGAPGSESLQQLERGEITRAEYLDVRAEAAVEHLRERLPEEQLEAVRSVIREQLESDPVLVELVRRVTLGTGGTAGSI